MNENNLDMNADAKQTELDRLIAKLLPELQNIDKRVYKTEDVDEFYRFHDVCTRIDSGKKDAAGGTIWISQMHGFKKIQIPNPLNPADEQLEALVEIYGDFTLVKSCLNAIAITGQQEARKVVKGDRKMTESEFAARYDALDPELIGRLKTMEYIRRHIMQEWESEQTDVTDGELRIF